MEIRHLKKTEIKDLQTFIHKFWKAEHILSTNDELMNYQHYNQKTGEYNWIIAKDDDGIQVILGFIPTSQFDRDIKRVDIWLAIWIRSDKQLPRGTGTKLLDYLEDYYKPDSVAAIGINDNIKKLYQKRGWFTSVLNHYVFINPGKIASYKPDKTFRRLDMGCDIDEKRVPEKSGRYFYTRYLLHPFYDYHIYQLDGMTLVTRRIDANGSACLRVVDMFGDVTGSEYALHQLCKLENVDYIDLLTNSNIPPIGMTHKEADLILPNWFEPFCQEDHPIQYAYKSDRLYTIYKGDSDQDRPNEL